MQDKGKIKVIESLGGRGRTMLQDERGFDSYERNFSRRSEEELEDTKNNA